MEEFQRNGNYVEAENCRINVEQLKKDYQARKLYELNMKHKQENTDLAHTHHQEMENFNKFWDKKMEQFHGDGQRLERDMAERHQHELRTTREDLEKQLPLKLK